MRFQMQLMALTVAACAGAGSKVWAADALKVAAASVDRNNRQMLRINFDNPNPKLEAVNGANSWIVYQKTTAGGKTTVTQLAVDHVETQSLKPGTAYEADVVLKQAVAGAPSIKGVTIWFAGPNGLQQAANLSTPTQLGTGTKNTAGPVTGAKGKSDADVYFNGSYATVQGGQPVYSIDAFAGYMQAIQSEKTYYGSIGLYGQTTTKSSPVADPNSFLTYLVYQRPVGDGGWWGGRHFQTPIFTERLFGAEFDRSARELNLINSPLLTLPFRPIQPRSFQSDKIILPRMTFVAGAEFVDVRKSALAPVNAWHTRGLFGATLNGGYAPKKKGLDSITLTGNWQVRLPSAPEIFYDTKFAPIDPTTHQPNLKKIPPKLGTQPRHYIDTKLTYNYTAWGGITLEYSYGSLPPVFNKTDSTFTFGLTLALQEGGFGRYSIVRP